MDIPLQDVSPERRWRRVKRFRRVGLLVLAVAVVALDQLTKRWIESTLDVGQFMPITFIFNIVHALNTGAAFSFLADESGWQRWLLIVLGVGISAALAISVVLQPLQKVGTPFALLIGGAMGNVVDRLTRGAVVDWLDFYLFRWHWPAFNIADMSIVAGAILLCLRTNDGQQKRGDEEVATARKTKIGH